MTHFLLPCTPIYGHVAPMLTIARRLVSRGHRVSVLTGSKYRSAVESYGLGFRPLPADADYDDADLDAWLPHRHRRTGIAAGRYDTIGMFIRPLAGQHRAFTEALAHDPADGVLCEAAFLGVLPTLVSSPRTDRVPIFGVSATPLSLRSTDCAPFGSALPPGRSTFTRIRNRQINWLLDHGPLRPVHRSLDAVLTELGAPDAGINFFDHVTTFDQTFHLAAAAFEYPRRETPSSIRFIGPLHPGPITAPAALPDWWGDLDGSRPVVHVTQGTMANADLSLLLAPTIQGLAGADVLVVATTGGQPVRALSALFGDRLPDNVRVAEFLPYDQLLPRVDVMVTNGGFGGVQRALAHGLPLVVAGASEDKPEVAARVAWTGAGIDLRRGRPSPNRIRRAVRTVLREPTYAEAARAQQRAIAELDDPATVIATTLEAAILTGPQAHSTSRGLTTTDVGNPRKV